MPDYQLSKIYEIRCNITNNIYYGSTTQKYLSSRITQHKRDFKRWLNDNKNTYISSFEILKNGDYKILLVENVKCNSKDELRQREQHYIDNNDCINKRKALRTEEEKKEQRKKYYEDNKEKENKQTKKYYKQNKEKAKERRKKYYKDNRLFFNSWGYEKRVFSCNLLNIDLSIFE